jgi:high-affinity Fe2+/Pb2+ permease
VPNNNAWSVIGAAVAVVTVFVLTALLNFFGTGNAWPTTMQGWATIVVPALCAGLLAVLTPHYSVSEARTGARLINTQHGDAPVVDKAGLQPERKV